MDVGKNKIFLFLKKRLYDVILILFVAFIFFVDLDEEKHTRENNQNLNNTEVGQISSDADSETSLKKEAPPEETEKTIIQKTPLEIEQPQVNAQSAGNIHPANAITQKPAPLSEVVSRMNTHQDAPNNLNSTLQNLKSTQGGTSTQDIVERNAYFQKLSEQLNTLQGSTSTDSSGSENQKDTSEDDQSNDESISVDEIDDFPEEDEAAAPVGGQQGVNPYTDLNTIPPPKVVE